MPGRDARSGDGLGAESRGADEQPENLPPRSASIVVDDAHRVVSVTPGLRALFGREPTELVGGPVVALVDPGDVDRLTAFLTDPHRRVGDITRIAVRVMDATDRPVWAEVTRVDLEGDGPGRSHLRLIPYGPDDGRRDVSPTTTDSNQFHALVQNSADIVLSVDPDGTIRFVNPAMLRTLGRSPEELLGSQILEMIDPADQPLVTRMMVGLLEHPEESWHIQFRALHTDGTTRWIDAQVQNLLTHPEVRGILGNGRDITERRLAERALRVSEERFRSLAAASPSAIVELDPDGRVTYANQRWDDLTGVTRTADTHLWSSVHPDDAEDLRQLVTGGVRDGLEAHVRVVRPGGELRWVELRVRSGDGPDGSTMCVGTLHDVTDLKRYQDELAHQALHDPVTGLPNRVQLTGKLEEALHRSRTSGDGLALLFVDLDRFKLVNDSLGHQVGDELLGAVARRLVRWSRPGDLVARFGGDEFLVLCEGVSDRDAALSLAEELRSNVGGPVVVGDARVFLSVSVGVALASGSEAAGEILRDADAAMYVAKRHGRNQAAVFEGSIHDSAVERLSLEQDLRRALDRGEFRLYYQPIVGVDDVEVTGVEALLRWEHPGHGLLAPDRFLAVAEEAGVLAALTGWILTTACVDAAAWEAPESGRPLDVFVNLSARQLAASDLSGLVSRALADSGLDPARLYLEVTEDVLPAGAVAAVRVLDDLRRTGVRIAVDDFGTGYSSLSYLTRLPVDLLKIDRSFVQGMSERPGDREVTAAIVALAHALGLSCIAEGVETREQLVTLRALGCGSAQGFLFSRPVPAEGFADLLEAGL